MESRTDEQIFDFVFKSLTLSQYHKHYKKTVEVANYWKSIICGENQESIILKKRENDTKTQKEQSVRLFNTHTPYLTNRLKSVFKKVDKTKRVNRILKPKDGDKMKDNIWEAFGNQVSAFHKKESLDEYLNTRLIDYASTDPNSYLLIDFMPFDNTKELPVIYPLVFSSEDTIIKGEDYRGLEFIGFRKAVKEVKKQNNKQLTDKKLQVQREFYKYFVYTRNNSYEIIVKDIAEQTDYDYTGAVEFSQAYADDKGQINQVTFYYKEGYHGSDNVPATCLGYLQDLTTEYESKESIYRAAKEVLNEHCEKKSKLDNQMSLFGFIRAYMYAQRCNYRDNNGSRCTNGYLSDNTICPNCQGTSLAEKQSRVSRNEFEITEVEIPLAVNGTNDDILDLSKLVHMVEIPEQVFKLYQDQVDHLAKLTSLALFNTNIFDKYNNESGAETATGIRELAQSKNNVIHEYAEHKAKVWKFIIDQMLHYYNIKDEVERGMVFDDDLVPLSDEQIISLIQSAKTANVSMEYIRAMETDLMAMKHKDNESELLWFITKNKWKPFYNKSENETLSILGMLPSDHNKKILWINFEFIFNDIRNAERLQGVNASYDKRFQFLEYEQQKDVLQYYINIYKTELEDERQPLELDVQIEE